MGKCGPPGQVASKARGVEAPKGDLSGISSSQVWVEPHRKHVLVQQALLVHVEERWQCMLSRVVWKSQTLRCASYCLRVCLIAACHLEARQHARLLSLDVRLSMCSCC